MPLLADKNHPIPITSKCTDNHKNAFENKKKCKFDNLNSIMYQRSILYDRMYTTCNHTCTCTSIYTPPLILYVRIHYSLPSPLGSQAKESAINALKYVKQCLSRSIVRLRHLNCCPAFMIF